MRPFLRRASRRRPPSRNSLRFSPYAWAKFLFLRDRGETEVGAFGRSSPKDLLRVDDIVLVRQVCTAVTVAFDDGAVADYFDASIDQGLRPAQFARIWLHTHPGASARPSLTDEATFERVFGTCDWAVMGILASEGARFARLRFSAGPGGEFEIPFEIDYRIPFPASDPEAWATEYEAAVQTLQAPLVADLGHGGEEPGVWDLEEEQFWPTCFPTKREQHAAQPQAHCHRPLG